MISHVGVELAAGIQGGTTQQWWALAAGPQRPGAAQPTRLQPLFQLCFSMLGTGGPSRGDVGWGTGWSQLRGGCRGLGVRVHA